MKKRFTILIAALMLLTMISQPTRLWGQTYKKVTSGPTGTATWDGEYIIVYETSGNGYVWTGVDANSNYISASISSNTITKPNDAVSVTIASMTGGYSIRVNGGTNDGKYISGTSGSNTTNFDTNPVANTLTYSSGVDIASNTSHFVFNSTSGTTRYRYYKSTTYSQSAYKKPQLYRKAYTVTYDANGGSGTMTDSNSPYFENSSVTTKTNNFTRDGYSFNGWNTASDGNGTAYAEGATFTISANTTLYAQWLATSSDPTITINTPTGGTIAVEDDDDNTIANGDQIAEETSLFIYATPAEGYSFDEWSVTETSSGGAVDLLYDSDEPENAFSMPDVDVTVDATFTKNKYNVAVLPVDYITITATYGGSNTITEGNNENVDYQTSISLSASVTTGKDYDWKITNSSDVDVTDAVLSGTTVTVPAYNIKIGATIVNTYTVTYNANGGTGTMTDSDSPYRDGSEVTIMTNTFTRANYAFSGWNTANDGSGASYDEGETFTISENTTLYAQWVPSYTITPSATNGTIGVYQSSKPAGDTVRLKVTPNSGYALVGLKIKKTSDSSVTDIVPTYNSDLKRYIFTMPDYNVTVKGVFDATNEVTYDFSAIDFSDWDNGYSERTVTYSDATVTFASASKQNSGSTIDDIPVTKGGDVSLVMKTVGGVTKKITGATFVCRQWGTKTQTITFHSSKNTGSTYQTYVGLTSTNFTISNDTLRSGVDAVKITFSSSSNQVGIESATIIIKGDAHNITCATGLEGGSISSSPKSASQGETVELTATPDANYALDSWTVTYTAGEEIFSIPVTDNKFTMPNFAVNVTASFRSARDLTVQYSINGTIDDGLEQEVTEGESVDIKGIPDGVTPVGYTFAGWSASASDLSTLLAADDSYTPSDNVTLYAVFTATKPAQFTLSITTSDFNSTSYAANNNEKTTAANAVSGETMDVKWTSYQVMQSGGMQWQKDNGYIYNSTDLGTIKSVTVTSSEGSFTTLYGTSENTGCASSTVGNGYFKTSVGGATGKTSEVKVTFVKSITRKFTRIIDENVDINATVTLTAPAIIESGQTLTIEDGGILNAGNYLTIVDGGALIIEDGGQIILPEDASINATVKRSITGESRGDAEWEAFASTINNPAIGSTNLITQTSTPYHFDLYMYNEAGAQWRNYRAHPTEFANLTNSRGYLYRNAATMDIAITGTLNTSDISAYTLSRSSENANLIGFNFVGNPYQMKIYKGVAISNTYLETGYYVLADGAWSVRDDDVAIAPGAGILVQAKDGGNGKNLNVTYTNASSKANHDNIMFTVANSEYSDIAYAIFDKGHGLNKINHRNAEVPMLYILQNSENFAIAMMDDNTKAFSLNFKAMTTGKYTLSCKTKGNYSYLHVIDRLTGEDVDMLLEDEYSFIASKQDNENRFIVKLEYSGNPEGSENSTFAWQNGSDIIVTGEGELQIFDVMGRRVSTVRVSGETTITAPSMQGVYIFKLNDKTQKIVVK